jgi:hypothetical protein
MKKEIIVVLLILCAELMIAMVSMAADETVDNSLYVKLLSDYVNQGIVDYQGFKKEEEKLDAYLDVLAAVDPEKLSRHDRFAFYVNAYNAWTIKLILTGYPGVKSIKDLGSIFSSPWKKKICRINGKMLSLDEIEHDILRPTFKDPRVHFAVNCASKGCPKLISTPYEGDILESQLNEVAREFINNPEKNYLKGDTLYVSSIFKWFAEDFNNDIPAFFKKYADDGLKKQLPKKSGDIKVKYLDYDWSLNGQ